VTHIVKAYLSSVAMIDYIYNGYAF